MELKALMYALIALLSMNALMVVIVILVFKKAEPEWIDYRRYYPPKAQLDRALVAVIVSALIDIAIIIFAVGIVLLAISIFENPDYTFVEVLSFAMILAQIACGQFSDRKICNHVPTEILALLLKVILLFILGFWGWMLLNEENSVYAELALLEAFIKLIILIIKEVRWHILKGQLYTQEFQPTNRLNTATQSAPSWRT